MAWCHCTINTADVNNCTSITLLLDWEKKKLFIWMLIHDVMEQNVQNPKKDRNISARLVPALGKTILDYSVECHIPTTFRRIIQKGPNYQQMSIFKKNFVLTFSKIVGISSFAFNQL